MSRANWTKDGLYKELPERDGIVTLFRKFEMGTWIVQYKGDEQIGVILISEENLKEIQNAPALKVGDGTTPQG